MSHVRRRLWLSVAIVLAAVAASGLLIGALARAAEPSGPVITFTPVGAPPIACGTEPDVSSLSVPEGTAVVVANRTEVPASVVVSGETVMSVAHGEGASLTLAPGQYDIRLVPQCGVVVRTSSVAVVVSAQTPPPTSPPASPLTSPPDGTAAAPPTTAARPVATGTSAATGPGGPPPRGTAGSTAGPAPIPAATHVDPSPSPSATTTPAVAPLSGVITADPVALGGQDHPKGLRLLAAIATICVLGVTAAIIRAIVRLSP